MQPSPAQFLNRRKMTGVLTALLAITATAFMANAADVPFLVSAYEAAAKKPDNPGINATVTITTLGIASKPPKVLVAQGPLAMEGDFLGGRLPITFDKPNAVPAGEHTLYFTVSKTGRVSTQWLLNGKPYEGKFTKAFDTDVAGSTLTKKLDWYGANRLITVAIERKLSIIGGIKLKPTPKPIIIGGVIKLKPTPTPKPVFKPVIVGGIKLPPKGRNVKVTARFVVTNSDDGIAGVLGYADKQVELSGAVQLGNQFPLSFNHKNAHGGDEFKSKKMNTVTLNYSDPNYRFFEVKGHIYDTDKASADDTLWVASEKIDLIKIMESNQEYRIKGDHNSESGDVYIRVADEGEFR